MKIAGSPIETEEPPCCAQVDTSGFDVRGSNWSEQSVAMLEDRIKKRNASDDCQGKNPSIRYRRKYPYTPRPSCRINRAFWGRCSKGQIRECLTVAALLYNPLHQ